MIEDVNEFLRALFDKAVAAAQPDLVVPQYMPRPHEKGRVFVVGAGKASAQMARAFEQNWTHYDTHPLSGIVITRYGYAAPCEHIEILEAAHPVPDEAGLAATQRLINFLHDQNLTENDLVVCLISGGGSALLVAPLACLSFSEKADINQQLLNSGAPIQDMNIVRKHMSAIKGGGLAALCQPAHLHSLVISDVAGDDLHSIASAPTLSDETSAKDALNIARKYNIDLPAGLQQAWQSETEQLGACVEVSQNIHIIASAQLSLDAAASYADERGVAVEIISDALEGDAEACALMHVDLAKSHQGKRRGALLLLSGGETTVRVRGNGRGGRNGQFALAALGALGGQAGIYGLACDTDGIDGSEDNAGAFFTPELFDRAQEQGVDLAAYLENNDSYGLFEQIDGLITTGPTQTNVNDFRAIYIENATS